MPHEAQAYGSILTQVALRTLEEAAFIFAETTPQHQTWESPPVEVRIHFRGPKSGVLRLRTTSEFGRTVAANLLGLEPDDPEADSSAQKALAELLNILAGTLTAKLFTTKVVCHLGIPELGPHAPLTQSNSQAWVGLVTDDSCPMELDLFLDSSRQEGADPKRVSS